MVYRDVCSVCFRSFVGCDVCSLFPSVIGWLVIKIAKKRKSILSFSGCKSKKKCAIKMLIWIPIQCKEQIGDCWWLSSRVLRSLEYRRVMRLRTFWLSSSNGARVKTHTHTHAQSRLLSGCHREFVTTLRSWSSWSSRRSSSNNVNDFCEANNKRNLLSHFFTLSLHGCNGAVAGAVAAAVIKWK